MSFWRKTLLVGFLAKQFDFYKMQMSRGSGECHLSISDWRCSQTKVSFFGQNKEKAMMITVTMAIEKVSTGWTLTIWTGWTGWVLEMLAHLKPWSSSPFLQLWQRRFVRDCCSHNGKDTLMVLLVGFRCNYLASLNIGSISISNSDSDTLWRIQRNIYPHSNVFQKFFQSIFLCWASSSLPARLVLTRRQLWVTDGTVPLIIPGDLRCPAHEEH